MSEKIEYPQIDPDKEAVQSKYIDGVHEELGRCLYIHDEEAVDIVLSTAVANFLPGASIWLLLVGPSGGGKTALLNMFTDSELSKPISKFTKNTLLSGDMNLPSNSGLLFQMNDKLIIIKDLAPILEMGKEHRGEILSDLRDAYDGLVSKSWGTGRNTRWEGSFGLIGAATNAIDRHWKVFSELGERFLRVNLRTDSKAQTAFAIEQVGSEEEEVKASLKRVGSEFLDHYKEAVSTTHPLVPDYLKSTILELGILVARLRTPVQRDRSKHVWTRPQAEIGTRLTKQLIKLATAAAVLYESPSVTEYGEYRLALRTALDCIPTNRVYLLSGLLDGGRSAGELANHVGLPQTTVEYELIDLRLLGVTTKLPTGDGWAIEEETMAALRNTDLAGYISHNVPSPNLIGTAA